MSDFLKNLITLSLSLGTEARGLAILGEGNTSARIDQDRFLVKASGTNLGTLREEDVVECHSAPLLALIAGGAMEDLAVDQALLDCRVDHSAKKPSMEALFHAYLLSLEGIAYVGHTHPTTANGLLCSPVAPRDGGDPPLFPMRSCVVAVAQSCKLPYTDPGLVLAKAIRKGVENFLKEEGEMLPRNPAAKPRRHHAWGFAPGGGSCHVHDRKGRQNPPCCDLSRWGARPHR